MNVLVQQISGTRIAISSGRSTISVGGPDDDFSSVDLLLGALGSCMLGTLLTDASERLIAVQGAEIRLRAVQTANTHPVLARVRGRLIMSAPEDEEARTRLADSAMSCKIHESLQRGIEVAIEVNH